LRKTAIERLNLAALSPLKLHLRHQASVSFLFAPVVAVSTPAKQQKVSLSSLQFEVSMRLYALAM
jgi:hypothetical protein